MRQAIYNITAIQNDTWNGASFTLTLNGAAMDLAGAAISMKIATTAGTVIKTIDNGATGGITVTGANAFSVDAFIPTFAAGRYDYDIQITFVSGVVKTYIKGKFCLIEDID